jgi:hypothetical protein
MKKSGGRVVVAQPSALDDVAQNLATLVSQTVMGRHGITFMQLLTALNALEKILPFVSEDVPLTKEYVDDLRKRVHSASLARAEV